MLKQILVITGLLMASPFEKVEAQKPQFVEVPIVLHTQSGNLYGTLTQPKKKKIAPVALIIAGSGPTDRNGNNPVMKNESLSKLAQHLACKGIASVRYDKRGVGESIASGKSEDKMRFDDYVEDTKQWLALLKDDARFSRVVVIGHSEGALIGMLAAAQFSCPFVSIAGSGRLAAVLLKEQLAGQPVVIKDASYAIIDSLVQGKQIAAVPPALAAVFRPSVQPYLISWFRYDPTVEIQKVKSPVLLVQGSNDLQVKVSDAELLKAACPKAKLEIIPQMNHVFREINGDATQNIQSYSNLSLPIAEKLVSVIADFINRIKK